MKMQKKTGSRNTRSYILCMVLTVAMALFTTGCKGSTENQTASTAESGTTVQTDGAAVGKGSTVFPLTITDKDGVETTLEIHTDKATVGEALTELGVIAGEEGDYGLYVKTVNGITADYDTDGYYWAFYVNGEYAQTGVDSTEITEGDSYSFKVEK